MHAPVGFVIRKCVEDYQILDSDVTIPKGTTAFFPVDGLHYDSKYYDQPKKFSPERHSDEAKSGKTFVDMPIMAFGNGPRTCLGIRLGKLQTKIGLCHLLQKFEFTLDDVHKFKPLKYRTRAIIKASSTGIHLKVAAR